MIKISRAKIGDLMEIKNLLSETWKSTYGNIYSQDTIKNITSDWHDPKKSASQIEDPNCFFAVAKENNKIIGLTTVSQVDDKVIMMYRLYIGQNYQRQGIGTKLMQSAISFFKGYKKIRIEVEEKNNKGVYFYRKHGFIIIGKKIEEIGNDKMPTVEMEKDL